MMSTKFKKLISLSVAAMLILSVATGCGSTPPATSASPSESSVAAASSEAPASSEASTPAKPAEATVTYMDWEGADMMKSLEASMAKFTADNPGLKVINIPAPLQDYGTKLQQMIAANAAPDVFRVGNDMAISYGSSGLAYDITEYCNNDQTFIKTFFPTSVETFQYNGKQMGLPALLNCYGVFYNKKTLAGAGVTEPKAGWSYDDLFAAADKLKDSAKGTFGIYGMSTDPYFLSLYTASAGGKPFMDSFYPVKNVTIDPKMSEIITKIQGAVKGGSMPPITQDQGDIATKFIQGEIPMMFYGQWVADQLIRTAPDLDWGFVPNPTVKPDSFHTILDATGFSISATTPHPDEAYMLLKYVVGTAYNTVLVDFPVAPAAYVDASAPYFQKLKDTGHADLADGLDYMLKSPNKLLVRLLDPWAGDANKFGTDFTNIVDGTAPLTDLDAYAKNVNDVIANATVK